MPAGGLIALLDDIASIADDVAKMTMSAADDIGSVTVKASQKAAGIVTDDLAVTAEQVNGIRRDRELRVIWGVAKGSFKNKMLYLIPGALLLTALAPWALAPLLVAGGLFLCYEGAEKLIEKFHPHVAQEIGVDVVASTPEELERIKVAEAIKTDLVLSGEIIVMGLGVMSEHAMSWAMTAVALVAFGIFMTAAVYGTVAILVKMDDAGEAMAKIKSTRYLGRFLVVLAPKLLHVISWIGLIAMLAVGGHLVVHYIPPLHHLISAYIPDTLPMAIVYLREIVSGLIAGGLVILALATGIPARIFKAIKKMKKNVLPG